MTRLIFTFVFVFVFAMSAHAATVYVSTTGDNGNPGTESEPWRTIQFAENNAAVGDTIRIEAGTYVEAVDVNKNDLTFFGEDGVIMEPPSPGTSQEAFDIKSGTSGILIRDVEMRGGYGETVFIRSGASDIQVKAFSAHGNAVGVLMSGANDVRLTEGDIYDNLNGVNIVNSSNVRIREVASHDNDDGLGCAGDADGFVADDDSNNIQITDSVAYNNSEDGMDLQATRSKVQESIAYGNCRGIRFWADDSFCKNCLSYDNTNVGMTVTMLTTGTGNKVEIYNSTIDDGTSGIDANANVNRPYRLWLQNNIVTSDGKVVEVQDNIDVKARNNIFWRASSDTGDNFRIVGSNPTVRYSNDDIEDGTFHDETGYGLNTRAVDPKYVNAGSDDYSLQSSSDGVDMGFDFPSAPIIDIEGTLRPQGAEYDMGAYEQ